MGEENWNRAVNCLLVSKKLLLGWRFANSDSRLAIRD
jgi:hypothetical protein